MKCYKIIYKNGTEIFTLANNPKEVIQKFDLATKENIYTRIIEIPAKIEKLN